jgi:hypothetical protein
MSTPDKNNPDGLGSYGKSPSRFVGRPRGQAKPLPNDATEGPMGSAAADQEVFEEAQREQCRKQALESSSPASVQPGAGGEEKRLNALPENKTKLSEGDEA